MKETKPLVCHLTTVHRADDVRIFKKECSSLIKKYRVKLIAVNAESSTKNGVEIIGVPCKFSSRVGRWWKATYLVYKKAMEVNAAIYHFHDPELIPAALRLKRKGKKVIFDSHEFYGYQIKTKTYIPSLIRNIVAAAYMKYEKYACEKFDATICVCTIKGKNYFENRAKKVEFITNAPKLCEFADLSPTKFKRTQRVCQVGALTYNRGVSHLVKAMDKTSSRLVLAGKFESNEYRASLEALPQWEKVDYMGFLSRNEVNEMLQTCTAGIATLLNVGQYNLFDAFPIKVYEYMAAALPVIISRSDYAEKILAVHKFGICVNPDSPEEIAEAINYISSHPKEAEILGQNGRKAILEKYNWTVEEKKLLDIYEQILTHNQ